MRSRMERYNNLVLSRENPTSRTSKNEDLYRDFSKNDPFVASESIDTNNAVSLSSLDRTYKTREGYHRIKEYGNILPKPKIESELDKYRTLYPEDKEKTYDINSVLEHARKNREEVDELEHKRKLRNSEYNILTSLDLDEIKKYREEKEKRQHNEDEELTELINTITSHTLAGQLSDTNRDLMSDLLPSKEDETVITGTLSQEIMSNATVTTSMGDADDEKNAIKDIDKSFYTKSMDLSNEDFEMDDELANETRTSVGKTVVKVILLVLLVAILAVIIYFVVTTFTGK